MTLFERFAPGVLALQDGTTTSPSMLIGSEGRRQLYYIPFDFVNRDARLVMVGITPGNNQLSIAYKTARPLIARGASEQEVLRAVKKEASFGGGGVRPNLLRMMKHFEFAKLLGVRSEESLWSENSGLMHTTSVVPHAAFIGDKMFAGSFDDVLRSNLFRTCFEDHFVESLKTINASAYYVGLGKTPAAALDWCVSKGVLKPNQVLGAFAHPSRSGGSTVDYYLQVKRRENMKQNDPVLKGGRAEWLDNAYAGMKQAVGNLAFT